MTKATRRTLRVSASTPYRQWPEFLTYAEAGEILGVCEKTIQRMVAAVELPTERHGRLRRIHKSAIRPRTAG